MFGRHLAKVKKFKKEIEPQEVLLDSLAQKKEQEFGISEKKLEVPLSQKILRFVWFGFLILILLLLTKTAQLQFIESATLSQLSEENKFAIRLIQSQRGVIYDRNLNQLVFNEPSFDLICRPTELPESEVEIKEIFQGIAQILEIDYEDLLDKIMPSSLAEIPVAEGLDHQTLILFEAQRQEFPGFEIKNNAVREYLSGPVLAHVIGYQRPTGEKKGLEEYYDNILQAQPGEIQIKRDVYGNPIAKEIISQPSSGESLVLYLDYQLQEKLTEVLAGAIRNVGAKSGAAVALDPQTGGVLGLVSWPSFDSNLFSQEITQEQWQVLNQNPQKPFFNRAISGEYPTGSTIKPLIATAALQEEIISPDKHINCQGRIIIPNPWIPNASSTKEDWMVHGWTDMRKAIAQSCNVYFYTVGGGYQDQEGLGPSRIKKYLQLFGWGEPTKIDLAGERDGLIPDPTWKKETKEEDWWDGDTYNLAIGQGDILATPLQVAIAFSAVANGGTLYQPQIVQRVFNGEEFQPEIVRQNFISSENLQVVREGMRDGVIYGSSAVLSSLPVKAAAKTGTAQTWQEDVYHNWLTVFAPYDNPEIVLTIMIENVVGVQAAVLPVAQEVLTWYFTR